MNETIRQLLDQIAGLEGDLHKAVLAQEATALYKLKGKRIEFEESVLEAHRRVKRGFFSWLARDRPQNLVTGPIIYSMVIPLALLDLCVSFYQFTCFPVYGVSKVRRKDYFVYDRQQLEYLNFVEKFHCTYCAYATGLIAYVSEIVARTEEYFCPIKHARRTLGAHERYARFLDYGESADFQRRLEEYRVALGDAEVKH
jgi:hypothetical protein